MAERFGIVSALGRSEQGTLALYQIVARIIQQASRLSALRMTDSHAVTEILGLEKVKKDALYRNLSWLATQQEKIEKKLWETRLKGKSKAPQLFLYDVTSSYLEDEKNDLAAYGYNRDGKKSKQQIVIGLLTDEDGVPIAVRVFEGNTVDTKTVSEQIRILVESFSVKEATLVGDRGMLKSPQVKLLPKDFRHITALTKPSIRKILKKNIINQNLFDSDLHEVSHDGIRYIVRRNPIRQKEIQENRQKKFEFIEEKCLLLNEYLILHPKANVETAKKNLMGRITRLKIQSWVSVVQEDDQRKIKVLKNEVALKNESFLDGVYVIKTDVSSEQASGKVIHDRYKSLAKVEAAFRTMKTGHLEIRPVYVRKDPRTRGHVLVVMLAYIIIQQLGEYWRERDGMTIEEILAEIDSLSVIHVIRDQVSCLKLPKLPDRVASFVNKAQLSFPEVLPITKPPVPTKKISL